jgi:2-isopropylmalate synthase
MDAGDGDGMVDACYKVIARIVGQQPTLERYLVSAITGGTEAQGEVSCLLRDGDYTATGQGVHTDIVMASALAYINAFNRLDYRKRYHRHTGVGGP